MVEQPKGALELTQEPGSGRIVGDLEKKLQEDGDPERAVGEKKYLKSDLEFFGTPMGAIREVVKTFARESRSKDDLVAIALTLWARPIFEPRMACVLMLERCAPSLSLQDLPAIEKLIRESRTWALVDPLAVNVTGELVLHHRNALQALGRWATDEDFWIRRSLLLAHLKPLRRGLGNSSFYHHADNMLSEKEFFIRKAIGWVLRDIAKGNPAEVFEWLAPRTHRASGVTMREATKYLDEHQRHTLMTAYKLRQPASVQS